MDRTPNIKPPFHPRLDLLDCIRLDEQLFLRGEIHITVSRWLLTTAAMLLVESLKFLVLPVLRSLPLLLLV